VDKNPVKEKEETRTAIKRLPFGEPM